LPSMWVCVSLKLIKVIKKFIAAKWIHPFVEDAVLKYHVVNPIILLLGLYSYTVCNEIHIDTYT